jgi:hypothetical protein
MIDRTDRGSAARRQPVRAAVNGYRGGRGSRGRARPRRVGWLTVVLAAIAVLAAACGGSSSSDATGSSPYAKALAYSDCMRAHGVPGFPDPQSNGAILVTPKDHLAQGSPTFVAANKACQHLDPPTKLSPAQQRHVAAQALKFAACVRAHGVPDFSDPIVSANGVAFHMPPGGPNSPGFRAAQQACKKYMPGLPG